MKKMQIPILISFAFGGFIGYFVCFLRQALKEPAPQRPTTNQILAQNAAPKTCKAANCYDEPKEGSDYCKDHWYYESKQTN